MIELKGVTLNYQGKKIISGLDLRINRGEKILIYGPSGIGKSSLFYLILGFVVPAKGEVIFDGIPLNERSVWEIRGRISYLDQSVSLPEGKVLDFLKSVFEYKKNSFLSFPYDKVKELFDYFELPVAIMDKDIEDLSGGEKQRIALIVTALLQRRVLLLDEPTSSLDRHLKDKTAEFFLSGKDFTVVVISHDSVWSNNSLVKVFDLKERKWLQ